MGRAREAITGDKAVAPRTQRYTDGAHIIRIVVSMLRRLRVVAACGLRSRCDGPQIVGQSEIFTVDVTER